MLKKIILILSFAILLSPHNYLFAKVEINEIMYDLKTGSDDGREWVEVFNNGEGSVDLSSFKFLEGGINHKLTLTQGDAKVGAQGYAIIVSDPEKFKADFPSFSGIIFDSTFSLSNSGEVLTLKDGDTIVDQYAYQSNLGGAGDGHSLQFVNGSWVATTPTLGTENKITIPSPKPNPPAPTPKPNQVSEEISEEQNKISTSNEIEIPAADSIPSISTAVIPTEENRSYLFILILVLLLGIGGGAVYFIRRKKITPNIGDDFDILDE